MVCSLCSDNKAPLRYMKYQPARVCDDCFDKLKKGQSFVCLFVCFYFESHPCSQTCTRSILCESTGKENRNNFTTFFFPNPLTKTSTSALMFGYPLLPHTCLRITFVNKVAFVQCSHKWKTENAFNFNFLKYLNHILPFTRWTSWFHLIFIFPYIPLI